MDIQKENLEKVKKLSLENPSAIYRHPNGSIVFQGMVFRDQQELDTFLNIARSKPIKAIAKFLKFFRRK